MYRSYHEQVVYGTASKQTYQRLTDPVIFIVKDIAISVKEVCKELSQVVIIRFFKEIQSPHVAQVGGHFFCEMELKLRQCTGGKSARDMWPFEKNSLTRETLTEHFYWGCPFGISNFLIALLKCVSLNE